MVEMNIWVKKPNGREGSGHGQESKASWKIVAGSGSYTEQRYSYRTES